MEETFDRLTETGNRDNIASNPFFYNPLKEYTFPFSTENLKKIEKIAGYHSIFFQSLAFYTHNNFEIHAFTETPEVREIPWEELDKSDDRKIEKIFVQYIALYDTAQAIELDFIDFEMLRLMDNGTIQLPILWTEKKTPQIRQILQNFQKCSYFNNKNIDENNYRNIYDRLKIKYPFQHHETYIYNTNDFSSITLLNAYPLNEGTHDINLKIGINTIHPIQQSIIRKNLYRNYLSNNLFWLDYRDTQVSLPVYLSWVLNGKQGALEEQVETTDYLSIIEKFDRLLKKSSTNSIMLIVDRLTRCEDAEFINILFEILGKDSECAGNTIILICLEITQACRNRINFDLEFNDNPRNIAENYFYFETQSGRGDEGGKTGRISPENNDNCDNNENNRNNAIENEIPLSGADTLFDPTNPGVIHIIPDSEYFLPLKEWMFQQTGNDPSPSFKLALATIYKWEKDYSRMTDLLSQIRGHTWESQELSDLHHYLEFIHCEKQSDTKHADKHLGKIKTELFKKRASIQLADRYIYSHDFDTARDILSESNEYFIRNQLNCDEIETLSQSAKLLRETGDYEAAENAYQNLIIRSELKNLKLISANIAVDLGNFHTIRNNVYKAEIWYKKAYKIFRHLKNQNGIQLVESNLVDIDIYTGNWKDAKNKLETVLTYDKQKNAPMPMGIDYYNIAHIEYLKNNFDIALELLHTSISYFEKKHSLVHLLECEILKIKIAMASGKIDTVCLDLFKRNDTLLSSDQRTTVTVFELFLKHIANPKIAGSKSSVLTATLIDKISSVQSFTARYELLLSIIHHYKNPGLLDQLKILSMALTPGKKTYYYYEYYYIYYSYFFDKDQWNRLDNIEEEIERFNEIYYFFLRNQRKISSPIYAHKLYLDTREARCNVFKNAELVGHSMHWKLPEDFFNSLTHHLMRIFKGTIGYIKLSIFEKNGIDSEVTKSSDGIQPLFCFSTSRQFESLTAQMMAFALKTLTHLNMGLEDIKQQPHFTSKEKAFYHYKNTKVNLWDISESIFGILLIAFTDERYSTYEIFERHNDFFTKFGSLIDRYYENDFKINLKLDFMIGESSVMKRLKEQISKLGKVDFSLLIRGESGSGKELVAKAVHKLSRRMQKPFVPVNAAAIPENLLEAELFGYKKGAFTGAVENKTGLIEEADGGTLFLDEIADLPITLQAKLLRVLQENEIRRLGENKIHPVNIRLISATNKNLKELISQNKFREDLYYRIQDLTIDVPPLRERTEDIPLLVRHFLKKYCFPIPGERELQHIINYFKTRTYAGNIRELESNVKRLITYYPEFEPSPVFHTNSNINNHNINFTPNSRDNDNYYAKDENDEPENPGLVESRLEFEKQMILNALSQNEWNKLKTAAALKISRQYLFELLIKHKISR